MYQREYEAGEVVEMSTKTLVEALPTCSFCDKQAYYDGRTNMGMWANMCEDHFKQYGVGLGVGRGQRLVVVPLPCPLCGAMIEPEGKVDADGCYSVCPECGEEIDLEAL